MSYLYSYLHVQVIEGKCDDPTLCQQWTHDDFVCGIDAPTFVYDKILQYISEFENDNWLENRLTCNFLLYSKSICYINNNLVTIKRLYALINVF